MKKISRKLLKIIRFFFIFFIFIGINGIFAFFPIMGYLNPIYGGYNREIVYIKNEPSQAGYFMMVDELKDKNDPSLEMCIHGIGNLRIEDEKRYCEWETENNVSLRATILYPREIEMEKEMGWYAELEDYIPYVKIKVPRDTDHVITMLYPSNSSFEHPQANISYWNDQENNEEFLNVIVNQSDYWFFDNLRSVEIKEYPSIEFQNEGFIKPNISMDGDFLFMRLNKNSEINRLLGNEMTELLWNNEEISQLSSIKSQDSPLTYYMDAENTILSNYSSEYTPPSYTPFSQRVQKDAIDDSLDKLSEQHPCLYFNHSERINYLNKFKTEQPWKEWYQKLKDSLLDLNSFKVENYDQNSRHNHALNFATVGYFEDNETLVNAAKKFLLKIYQVEDDYSKHLRRSYASLKYALTFDLIYNYLNSSEQSEIAGYLDDTAEPLYLEMDESPDNNWRVVMCAGLIMAGVMLNNSDYIQKAEEQIAWYLNEKTLAEGAAFEGQGYAAYAWIYGIQTVNLLKRFQLRNYYEDSRMIETLEFMAECATPNGYYPMFEDCGYGGNQNEICLQVCGHLFEEGFETLASNLMWLQSFHSNSSSTHSIFPRLFTYKKGIKMKKPEIGKNKSIVFPNSGIASFRDGFDSNATYFSISCKTYDQSHDHEDENSFELFAFGEKLLTNPGYPGWGAPHHQNWTVKSEASNTYIFNEEGQKRKEAEGFEKWILAEDLNYIKCMGENLYTGKDNIKNNPSILLYYFGIIGITFILISFVYLINRKLRSSEN